MTHRVIEQVGTRTFRTFLPGTDDKQHEVRGLDVRDLLNSPGLEGETVVASAFDKYAAELPISDFTDDNVIAAIEVDGKPVTVHDKGPAWIVYPRNETPASETAIYETRSVWQLVDIQIK